MLAPQQSDFTFHEDRPGHDHNHEPDVGTELKSAAVWACKKRAMENFFEPIGDIVDSAMAMLTLDDDVSPVNEKNFTRCVQRERAAHYPQIDFKDPNYEVKLNLLKGETVKIIISKRTVLSFEFHFYVGAENIIHIIIWVKDGSKKIRHDMFISKLQLYYLDLAERLYIDGTFKMSPTGFMQLLTVKTNSDT